MLLSKSTTINIYIYEKFRVHLYIYILKDITNITRQQTNKQKTIHF